MRLGLWAHRKERAFGTGAGRNLLTPVPEPGKGVENALPAFVVDGFSQTHFISQYGGSGRALLLLADTTALFLPVSRLSWLLRT